LGVRQHGHGESLTAAMRGSQQRHGVGDGGAGCFITHCGDNAGENPSLGTALTWKTMPGKSCKDAFFGEKSSLWLGCVVARIDVPIRLGEVPLRLVLISQSNRTEFVRVLIDAPAQLNMLYI